MGERWGGGWGEGGLESWWLRVAVSESLRAEGGMVGMGHVGIGGADGGCVSALGGAGLWWLGDRGIESCGISSSSGSTTATSPQSMDKISRNLFINGKIPKQLFQFPPKP